jgi:hypothetical protein
MHVSVVGVRRLELPVRPGSERAGGLAHAGEAMESWNIPWRISCARNKASQALFPNSKIFVIGFNKTGTSALWQWMQSYAIRSVHWDGGQLAENIEALAGDPPALRRYFSAATAYSDMLSISDDHLIEANRHFRLFHELYPRAYFILNDRDIEGWIRSRTSHRKGTFMERSMAFFGKSSEEVVEIWRRQHEAHRQATLNYFAGNPRFIHFYIDSDPIQRLIRFLSPTYSLGKQGWQIVNATESKI